MKQIHLLNLLTKECDITRLCFCF